MKPNVDCLHSNVTIQFLSFLLSVFLLSLKRNKFLSLLLSLFKEKEVYLFLLSLKRNKFIFFLLALFLLSWNRKKFLSLLLSLFIALSLSYLLKEKEVLSFFREKISSSFPCFLYFFSLKRERSFSLSLMRKKSLCILLSLFLLS